jgi:hypothetical protein
VTLRSEKALVTVALAALLHPLFQSVAAHGMNRPLPPPAWLVTPLDRTLPVVPMAVWLYVSWYPAAALGLFADRSTLRRLYCAYTLAFVICLAAYLAFPVTIERPALDSAPGLSAAVLRALYTADRPVNLFPSFHAAVAGILLQLRPPSAVLRRGLVTWMLAICAACVLTRQHYVLDVVAGLGVGGIVVAIVDGVRSRMIRAGHHASPRPRGDIPERVELTA